MQKTTKPSLGHNLIIHQPLYIGSWMSDFGKKIKNKKMLMSS
jgi:hypothetical protein